MHNNTTHFRRVKTCTPSTLHTSQQTHTHHPLIISIIIIIVHSFCNTYYVSFSLSARHVNIILANYFIVVVYIRPRAYGDVSGSFVCARPSGTQSVSVYYSIYYYVHTVYFVSNIASSATAAFAYIQF